jgi:hypothetical protein
MRQRLFRQEAIAQHTNRLYGRVLVIPNKLHTVFIAVFAVWLALALAWFFNSTYTRQEIVKGWLEVSPSASENGEVVVILLMPVQLTSLIYEGKVIAVEFSDFPSQKKIGHAATITSINKEIILANEINASDVKVTAPVQKITASLQSQFISPFGNKLKLRSGMRVTAKFELKTESLANYVFHDLLNPQSNRP